MPSRTTDTRIVIDASPAQVWDALLELDAYPRWNTVLGLRPWRRGRLRQGRRAWLVLKPFPVPVVVPVVVEEASEGRELRWAGGPWGLLRGHHFFRLRELDGKTELVHGEQFEGLLLPLLWPRMEGELQRLYTSLNAALAAHIEGSSESVPGVDTD